MQKPDDIPDEVMMLAEAANDEIFRIAHDEVHILNHTERKKVIARAILAERERNKAILQQLYDLLHNDTPNGGAASFLPGDGDGAEEYVDQAVAILRANGVKRYGSHT